jgi:hypothetical protein
MDSVLRKVAPANWYPRGNKAWGLFWSTHPS